MIEKITSVLGRDGLNFRMLRTIAAGSIALVITSTTVVGEVLCSQIGVSSKIVDQHRVITVDGFWPLQIVSSADCDVRQTCDYAITIVAGTRSEEHFSGITVPNLCERIFFRSEPVSDHSGNVMDMGDGVQLDARTGAQLHPLDQIYTHSGKSIVSIVGETSQVQIIRTDYSDLGPEKGWISLSIEDGTVLTADVAASRYTLQFISE